jgi:hypothetical protein
MSAYIKTGKVRAFVKSQGKRVGRDFLHALDVFVSEKLEAACRQHNGGRMTINREVAMVVFGKIR